MPSSSERGAWWRKRKCLVHQKVKAESRRKQKMTEGEWVAGGLHSERRRRATASALDAAIQERRGVRKQRPSPDASRLRLARRRPLPERERGTPAGGVG